MSSVSSFVILEKGRDVVYFSVAGGVCKVLGIVESREEGVFDYTIG